VKTLNHDEFADRHSYGYDGDALTVQFVTPKTIARIVQINREVDTAWDLYDQEAA
jgi:hypothetical protein